MRNEYGFTLTLWSLLVVLLVATDIIGSAPTDTGNSLDNYLILRLTSSSSESLRQLVHRLQADYDADVLAYSATFAEAVVAKNLMNEVTSAIAQAHVTYEVVTYHITRFLEERSQLRTSVRDTDQCAIKNSYLGFAEMQAFLQDVEKEANGAKVVLTSMGTSYEGRDMPVVEICAQEMKAKRTEKPVIVIDAGIHAREWIAPSMALNFINKLAVNPDNDEEVGELLKMFDWVIAPIVNPDGYEFSREKPANRLWRKTRTDAHSKICLGVDGNRNFDFDWDPENGASSNPCSSVYAGPAPLSEPETQHIRDWLTSWSDRTAMFITMHSFSQVLLYPPAGNLSRPLDNEDVYIDVGNAFAGALNATGRPTLVGKASELLYPAAGSTMDYAWGGAGIPLSYTIELSPSYWFDEFPNDNYALGFLYPEEKLADTIEATWTALKAMARAVKRHLDGCGIDK